jgi:hypothetical protein
MSLYGGDQKNRLCAVCHDSPFVETSVAIQPAIRSSMTFSFYPVIRDFSAPGSVDSSVREEVNTQS